MVCRQEMGTWEHVLPLFVPGYTVLFPTCSDNVLNVPLRGYTCTRILYPVTNSVPTYLLLERPRRRGRSKRPGTLFVTGYNMRVHTANCYPTFPTFDAPNKSQRFFLFPRGYMRVPVYPTYPVAKGICKRFGAMWVLFPWINANVMHPWLHNSPRHGGHWGGVFRFGCIGWCATVGHTSKGGGILLSFPPFPRNGGTKVLKWTSAIVFKGGS